MQNRVSRRAMLAGILSLGATACLRGTSPQARSPNQLVWAIGGADTASLERTTARLWNETHPDTPVRIDRLPNDADGQRIQFGLELNAQGAGFDVLGTDVIWTGEFAEYGWIDPLEDLRAEAEQKILEGPLRTAIYQGQFWVMPYTSNVGFLYYRTDLVQTPPRTWDEAVQVGRAAAEQARIAPYVGQGAAYEGLVVNYLELLWGAGGEVLTDDPFEVLFNTTDAAGIAAEFMRTSAQEGFYASSFNTMQEQQAQTTFAAGQAVLMRHWPSTFAVMADPANSEVVGNYGIAPLPVFDPAETTGALGGFNLAVSRFSQKKDLAREFIRFASLDEQAQIALAEVSRPPVLKAAYEQLQDDPVMRLLGEVLPGAQPRPPVPFYNDISVAMQEQIFPAYTGQKPVPSALEAIQRSIQTTIDRRQQILEGAS
ncbi:MAG: ABC transporter substrate-binding protein [Egibacteraceae bacterium]